MLSMKRLLSVFVTSLLMVCSSVVSSFVANGMPNPLSEEQWQIANSIEDKSERNAYIQKCAETNPWMIEWRENRMQYEN